jgi:epoxyqueuosine reductase QueG
MMIDIYPWLEKTAKRYEFDEVRIADATLSIETQQHLRDFLDKGYHGEMAWLEQTI